MLFHERHTYLEIYNQLCLVEKWFISIALDLKASRFEALMRNMKAISEAYKAKKLPELVHEMGNPVVITTLIDSMPFIKIQEAFHDLKSHQLPKSKLKKILQGTFYAKDEDAVTNEGRNILFELELAARFKLCGMRNLKFDDVEFDFGDVAFKIQCKRPRGAQSFLKHCNEAMTQLENQMNKAEEQMTPRGLIALAIDKVMGTDERFIKVKTAHELLRFLDEGITEFARTHKESWAGIKDARVLGVFLFLKYVAHVEETGIMSEGTQIFGIRFTKQGTIENQRMLDLEKAISVN